MKESASVYPVSSSNVLEAHNLSFSYSRGARSVINRWTADFPAGTTTALMGPSGRGKSTALYLLGLMLRPDTGSVVVDGVPASSLRDNERARLRGGLFGFVFQDAALDQSRSVIDNVVETALYRGARRSTAVRHGLALLDKFEVDVSPRSKPGQVSGGQAQRIALCRALLSNPRVLLADEPTGNLDAETTAVVVEALQNYAQQGAVVVVVTHSAKVAEACDRRLQL